VFPRVDPRVAGQLTRRALDALEAEVRAEEASSGAVVAVADGDHWTAGRDPTSDAFRAWGEVLASIEHRGRINPKSFETWLRPTFGLELEDEQLTVRVPSTQFQTWIENGYAQEIAEAIQATGLHVRGVRLRPPEKGPAGARRTS